MKTILYVGATLMIGASIYGFVDYKKTSRNKEFTKMYDSKETLEPVITNDKIKEIVTKAETKSNDKVVKVKKEPGKKNEVAEEKIITKTEMQPMETIIAEKVATNTILKENSASTTEKPVKTKRFSAKLFSRAALDEKYISKELKLEPIKEGPKGKIVTSSEKNKEQ